MADNTKDNKPTPNDQRQRTAQPGDAGKPQPMKGAPTAGDRDANDHGKMPPDRTPASNDQLDVDVGDDRSPQRAPQPGTYKPGMPKP